MPTPKGSILYEHSPVLYLAGSSWMRVLTTSTGVMAPCVMLQQMPPACKEDKRRA